MAEVSVFWDFEIRSCRAKDPFKPRGGHQKGMVFRQMACLGITRGRSIARSRKCYMLVNKSPIYS